jgi:hypothetical protein
LFEDNYDEIMVIRNSYLVKLVNNLSPGVDPMTMHCSAQVLNELTEVKTIYQELTSEASLDLMLKNIESEDIESQKFTFWILGYLALKYKLHEGVTSRTSIINTDEEEINMLEDEEVQTTTPHKEETTFKDETETLIFKTCF